MNISKKILSIKFFISAKKGFTLIELLIVIAVLGILAAVVLVAINPLEQLARGRDAGRKNSMGQLHNAVQAYYTSHDATYVPVLGGWITNLIAAGEVKSIPFNPAYNAGVIAAPCLATGGSVEGKWCYKIIGTDAIAYTTLESKTERTKSPACAAADAVYYLWSSSDGRAGTICIPSGAEPTSAGGYTYK